MKLNKFLFALLSICAATLAGCSATGTKSVENNSTQPVNTSSTPEKKIVENPRDPKIICALPGKIGLDVAEYKHTPDNLESTNDYKCFNYSGFTNPKFPGYTISLAAEGDAEIIKQVVISSTNYKQAAEGDERVAELGNEVWQKVFGKPMPDEVKAAILTDQGKSATYEKKFEFIPNVRVKREAKKGQYELTLYITELR